jgi:hypothetical protein
MVKSFADEVWKTVDLNHEKLRNKYDISSYGRIASYREKREDGKILRGSIVGGYPVFRYKQFTRKKGEPVRVRNEQKFVHKMAAENFLASKKTDDRFVIHLDYNKMNNHANNLKWATKREMEIHQQSNPTVIKAREERKLRKPYQGMKLNAKQVLKLKKKIFDPNRKIKYKKLAQQFNISEMQLYRIKSGENWSHITLDD